MLAVAAAAAVVVLFGRFIQFSSVHDLHSKSFFVIQLNRIV